MTPEGPLAPPPGFPNFPAEPGFHPRQPGVGGTGSSLTEALRRAGVPPLAAWAQPAPFDIRHATTVLALRYSEGVVMAGDRRATSGSAIAHRAMEKVHPADRHSGVAVAGAAGPAMELVRLFQLQLEHYEKVEG
ncbi:MAG: hypothetical protein ACRDYC_06840, partial [Acidimicrobiales bacterium]